MEVMHKQQHTAFEKLQAEKYRADTLDNHKKTLDQKMDTFSDKEVSVWALLLPIMTATTKPHVCLLL